MTSAGHDEAIARNGGLSGVLRARWQETSRRACRALDRMAGNERGVLAAIVACASILLVCQLLRHYAFMTPAYDLKIHEELVAGTLEGKVLHSDLLGGSFLSHHASFVFVLFAPLYALWPSPVWLLIMQGILVGCGAWFVWRLARGRGLRPMICVLLLLCFFAFKGLHTGYFRGFQQEVIGMCFALGFLWAVESRYPVRAVLLGMLTLSCREDFGIFLLGYGIALAFRREKRVYGIVTMVVSLAWICMCYGFILPAHAPSGRMAGMERWSQYGDEPSAILMTWLTNPLSTLKAVCNAGAVSHAWRLLLLPMADPATMSAIWIPWLVYTTSSFHQQAQLQGAYAAMFVAFLFMGAIRTLGRERMRSALGRDTIALMFFVVMLGINVRLCPFPEYVPGLPSAHSGIRLVNTRLAGKRVLAQGCVIPHLGKAYACDILGGPRAKNPDAYDIVVVARNRDSWPTDRTEVVRLTEELARDNAWARGEYGCIEIFEKRTRRDAAPGRRSGDADVAGDPEG